MVNQKIIEVTCGITLPEGAHIGRRLVIEHYGGIIVHGSTVMGDDCIIRQGVTLGNKGGAMLTGAPLLGDHVDIGAGAKLLGDIAVGDYAIIGANAVVVKSVPAGFVARGVPAEIYPKGVV